MIKNHLFLLKLILILTVGCNKNQVINGDIFALEVRIGSILNECDFDHLTLEVKLENSSKSDFSISQEAEYEFCYPGFLKSKIRWVFPDTLFYLLDERRKGNDIVIKKEDELTVKFRTYFVAEGQYLNKIFSNYENYINSDFYVEILVDNGNTIILNKSDLFEVKFIVGDTFIDRYDSLNLNFFKGPTASEQERFRYKIDSLVNEIGDNIDEPEVDL